MGLLTTGADISQMPVGFSLPVLHCFRPAAWGTDPGGPPDFDGDGTVGILDLLTLLANWGLCP